MHKITINCSCGNKIEVDINKADSFKSLIECSNCLINYYTYYNPKTESYEYGLIGEV